MSNLIITNEVTNIVIITNTFLNNSSELFPDKNTFFYTLSTIPQVIGGTIALFSAFAFFYIRKIDSEILNVGGGCLEKITDLCNVISKNPSYALHNNEYDITEIKNKFTRAIRLLLANKIGSLIEKIIETTKSYPPDCDIYKDFLTQFTETNQRRIIFFKKFKNIAIISFFAIIIPLLELPFSSQLHKSQCCLRCLSILIPVLLAVIAIALIIKLMVNSLR